MAIQALKGQQVPTRDAGAPHKQAPSGVHKSALTLLVIDRAVWAAAADIGSTVDMVDLPSTCIPLPGDCPVIRTALGAGVTMSIGDATYPSGLVNALDVAAAGQADLLASKAASTWGDPLWKLLGYPADPAKNIRLRATFAGANAAAGTLAYRISGTNA